MRMHTHTHTRTHACTHTSIHTQTHVCSPEALRTMFSISEKQFFQVCLLGFTLCQNWTAVDGLLTTKVHCICTCIYTWNLSNLSHNYTRHNLVHALYTLSSKNVMENFPCVSRALFLSHTHTGCIWHRQKEEESNWI